MYCSELKALTILSLYEGDILGNVNKLYFSKNLKKLLEIEISREDGTKFSLLTKNIYKIGTNAIIVKNSQGVSIKMEESDLSLCPIGSKAYSINGEYLGVVKEVFVNSRFITEKISLDNDNVLMPENIVSCGNNSIIFNTIKNKVNLKSFKPVSQPKVFKAEKLTVAKIMPNEKKQEQNVVNNKTSAEFLIGRTCIKDIYNFNNEILIKANGVINKRNLKEIKKFGKLRELMLYSK